MSIVSFTIRGRFGNNLFQYFAAKIIAKHTNSSYRFNISNKSNLTLNDTNFIKYYKALTDEFPDEESKILKKKIKNQNINLNGFFKSNFHLVRDKDYILNSMNKNNKDQINKEISVASLYKFIENFSHKFDKNDLVLHLRIGDFLALGYSIDPEIIIGIINSIEYNNLYIIVEKPKNKNDLSYIEKFNKIKHIRSENNLLHDFAMLYYAPNLICSCSTFCWAAAYLGVKKNVWMPENNSIINVQDGMKLFSVKINEKN